MVLCSCARLANCRLYSMCSNPFCLGDYWCVEWDCCSSMAMRDPPLSKKKKTTKAPGVRSATPGACSATPLSPKSAEQICRGFVPKTRRNVLAGLCKCLSSGRQNKIVSARRVVLKISWKNQRHTY